MKKLLAFVFAAAFAATTPVQASLIDLEYTVTETGSGATSEFTYDFQLIFDLEDAAYVDGMAVRTVVAGVSLPGTPRPFESSWLTAPTGWSSNVQVGRFTGTFIQFGTVSGAPYWVPTENDFTVRFSGVTANGDPGDLLWAYTGFTDPADPRSFFGVRDALVASRVNQLTEFDPPAAAIPLPAGLPLLLAGLGGLALIRRDRA